LGGLLLMLKGNSFSQDDIIVTVTNSIDR